MTQRLFLLLTGPARSGTRARMGNAIAVGDVVEFPLPAAPTPYDGSGPPAEPPRVEPRRRFWRVVEVEPEHGACTIEREEQGEPDGVGIRRAPVGVRRWVFVDEIRKLEIPSTLQGLV